jgi:hypothetical protein
MNITLHRTLMVCLLAGALALTIALVAAKDASAAPSPERAGGATQISGVALFDVANTCHSENVAGADYALLMSGDLEGCLYTFADEENARRSPSGTYLETGTELFVSSDPERPGTFSTTYRFEAKYEDVAPTFPIGEIFGRCQHPIVESLGTGDFEGVSGILFFKDEVETGEYFYRGHLRY